jgi:hypothetical protein
MGAGRKICSKNDDFNYSAGRERSEGKGQFAKMTSNLNEGQDALFPRVEIEFSEKARRPQH